ncbi:unnamed protein product, partial [Brenthis ino]
MGKYYSKNEDKEILINQNAVGSNGAVLAETNLQTHMLTNNILIAVVLVLFVVFSIYFGCKAWRKKERKWIEKRMQTEFVRRIRQRLSGKFNAANAAGSDAV